MNFSPSSISDSSEGRRCPKCGALIDENISSVVSKIDPQTGQPRITKIVLVCSADRSHVWEVPPVGFEWGL